MRIRAVASSTPGPAAGVVSIAAGAEARVMQVQSCPSLEKLRSFALGYGDEDEADTVQSHLAQCPTCLDALASLDENDRLLSAAQARPAIDPGDAEAIDELMGNLSRLRHEPGQDTDATGAWETCSLSAQQLDFLEPPLQPGDLGQLGNYRVVRQLGTGGMGIVFEAEDTALQRRVALKVMRPGVMAHPHSKERFVREARIAASLEHENIVTIYQVGEERGIVFLAQQLLKGESLEEKLKRENSLPVAELLRIGREIAAGLQAAHERGLVHRDIKPANIWIEASGRVKLLDFGLAKPLEEASLTRTGEVAGTPQYMAPEQAAGVAIDHRCDLFSLGCVLYRAATGRLPFAGRDVLAVLRALALENPAPVQTIVPSFPKPLSDLIAQLLAKEPQERPATAAVVAQRLAAIEEGTTLPAKRRPAWQYLVATAAASLLLLGGILNGAAIYRFATNKGVVIVETSDPEIEVTVTKNGERIVILDKTNGHRAVIESGRYEAVVGGKKGWTLETDRFTLIRGGEQVVKVSLEKAEQVVATKGSDPMPTERAMALPAAIPSNELPRALAIFQLEKPLPVERMLYAPDGIHAAVVSRDRTPIGDEQQRFPIYIWQLEGGVEVGQVVARTKRLPDVEFSGDSKSLFYLSAPKVLEWDIAAKRIVSVGAEMHAKPVMAIDGQRRRYLFGNPWEFQLRQLTNDELIHSFELPGEGIHHLSISPDGKRALSACLAWDTKGVLGTDHHLYVWDLVDGRLVDKLPGHNSAILYLAFLDNGRQALSRDADSAIYWDLVERKQLADMPIGAHCKLSVNAASKEYVVTMPLGVRTVDLGTKSMRSFARQGITCAALSPDGKRMLVGDAAGLVEEIELSSVDSVPLPALNDAATPP